MMKRLNGHRAIYNYWKIIIELVFKKHEKNVSINDFTNARMFGEEFLAYALDVSLDKIKQVLSNQGAELTANRIIVLKAIDQSAKSLKQSRQGNQSFEHIDRLNLSYQESIVNNWRNSINPPKLMKKTGLELEDLFSQYAAKSYIFNLLPKDHFMPYRRGAEIFGTKFHSSLIQAIITDPDFSKLFHTIDIENPYNTGGMIYNSFGSGYSIQAVGIIDQILNAAIHRMFVANEDSAHDLQKAVKSCLKDIRRTINGHNVKVEYVTIFEGIGLPEGTKIKIGNSYLQPLTEKLATLFRNDLMPAKNQEGRMGCILVSKVPYYMHIIENPTIANQMHRPDIEYTDVPPEVNLLPLIASLAFDSKIGLKSRLTKFLDPLGNSGHSFNPHYNSRLRQRITTTDDVLKLEAVSKIVSSKKLTNIQVATNRYISAINNRTDPTDALLDAVIGLENLFGQRSEISFAIANSVSRMLYDTYDERLFAFKELKEIYAARSTLVHGNTKNKKRLKVFEVSEKAVDFLGKSLMFIISKRPELIDCSSTERVRAIALRDENQAY